MVRRKKTKHGRRKDDSERLYTRYRGGEERWYVDLRDFDDVLLEGEPARRALVPEGAKHATADKNVALREMQKLVDKLEERRRIRDRHGIQPAEQEAEGEPQGVPLAAYVEHHVREKDRAGEVAGDWVLQTLRQLEKAVEFFGSDRDLTSIGVADVQEYVAHLRTLPSNRKKEDGTTKTISAGTQRHYLNSLSNLFRRAIAEEHVVLNPVAALLEKPTAKREEAEWLEAHEAALLLESARTFVADRDRGQISYVYPLLATYLLTGGRMSEVLGLEADDVSFQRRTVTFRPNDFRRLKTRTSHRSVPLWPQLEEILRAYLMEVERSGGLRRLLFPSPGPGPESMLTDFRKTLDSVAERVGWKAGEVRSKAFRHTYCAARLQTLDRGHPVSPYTVGKELGHGGTSMVERVYAHLGQVRHRSEVVEFRIEHHREQLADRLKSLSPEPAPE